MEHVHTASVSRDGKGLKTVCIRYYVRYLLVPWRYSRSLDSIHCPTLELGI